VSNGTKSFLDNFKEVAPINLVYSEDLKKKKRKEIKQTFLSTSLILEIANNN